MIATFRRSLGELKEMPLKADADTIVGAAVAAVLMKVRREIVISNTYIKRVKLTRNASRSLADLLPDRQIFSLSKRFQNSCQEMFGSNKNESPQLGNLLDSPHGPLKI